MKLACVFLAGLLLGSALGVYALGRIVNAQGAGKPSGNGDVNADGSIDLSDAVFLLNWLFTGGPEPVKIDCDEPPPPAGKARFRVVSDIRCNQDPVTVTLDACGSRVSDTTDAFGTFVPSACLEVPAQASCKVRLLGNTSCGALDYCLTLSTLPGDVYDVYFYFDTTLGGPKVIYFKGVVDPDGTCPEFPALGSPFEGSFSTSCSGAGGAFFPADGDWSTNG